MRRLPRCAQKEVEDENDDEDEDDWGSGGAGASMGEWLLSRRDRLIVARHEVPGYRCREAPVPEGRSKSLSVPEIFVLETELMPLQLALWHSWKYLLLTPAWVLAKEFPNSCQLARSRWLGETARWA